MGQEPAQGLQRGPTASRTRGTTGGAYRMEVGPEKQILGRGVPNPACLRKARRLSRPRRDSEGPCRERLSAPPLGRQSANQGKGRRTHAYADELARRSSGLDMGSEPNDWRL